MKTIHISIVLLSFFCQFAFTYVPPICQGSDVHVINLNTTNWQFYDLENDDIYCIISIGHEGHIIFNGRGSNPASNWTIIVALPSITYNAYVDVFGTQGMNGVVSAYLPGQGDKAYNVTVYEPEGPIGSSFLSAVGLKIELNCADHLSIMTDQAVNVNVDGTGNMDLEISTVNGSVVSFHRLFNSALVNNATVIIPASVTANTNQSLIMTGSASSTIADYSTWTQQLPFHSACLQLPNVSAPTPSDWFVQRVISYGMTEEDAYCQLKEFQANFLNISASSLLVSNLGPQTLQNLNVHSPNVSLSVANATPFDEITVAPQSLSVPDQFQITWDVSPSTTVFMDANVTSASTIVKFLCNSASSYRSHWTIGTSGKNSLEWKGNCQGTLYGEDFLPSFAFDGSGTADATLTVATNSSQVGEIVLNANSFGISFATESFTFVESLNPKLNLDINLKDKNYTAFLNMTKKGLVYSTCKFQQDATAVITSISDVSIGTYPKELHFDYDHQIITTEAGPVTNNCLRPHTHCTKSAYTRDGAYGLVPCYTSVEENKCMDVNVATFYANKIACPLVKPSDKHWTLTVNQVMESNTETFQEWTRWFFLAYFIASTLWFIGAFAVTGVVCMMAWASFTLNSILSKMSEEISNLTLRSLAESGDNAVMAFTGWSCGSESPLWGYHMALYVVVFILPVLYAILFAISQKYFAVPPNDTPSTIRDMFTRRNTVKFLRRIIVGMVFFLAPFMVGRVGETILSDVALAVMILLIGGFVWEAAIMDERPKGEYWNALPAFLAVTTALIASALGHPAVSISPEAVLGSYLVLLFLNLAGGTAFTWKMIEDIKHRVFVLVPYFFSFVSGVCYVSILYAKKNAPAGIMVLWFGFNGLALVAEMTLMFLLPWWGKVEQHAVPLADDKPIWVGLLDCLKPQNPERDSMKLNNMKQYHT